MIESLVAVFVVSGAAGLIYESIWTRYLGLFVGHSAYAQIIVLVIFLGGMSLGAHLIGRWSHRMRSPLFWYAAVELMIGALGMLFHDAFVGVTNSAYDHIFPSLGGVSLVAAKWMIASLLILPQSVLLGATFPLMTAGAIRMARAEAAPGRLLSLLYFSNSLGASFGVLLAGFVLIAALGLPGTLLTASLMNLVAAAVVAVVARAGQQHADAAASPHLERAGGPVRGDARILLWVSAGTAVASFVYEIAWIRMLSLVLGSATHSFEIMLSAFILGLALGALWVHSRADTIRDPVKFLGVMQWVMGVLAVATLPLYVASFDWLATVLHTVQQNESGYRAFSFARYLIALVIMLPATFCAGTTLPLITRVLMRDGAGERAIGVVYAVNTLGSIAGVIIASLILMPVLGLKKLLVFGAILDTGLGVWLISRRLGDGGPAPRRRFSVGSPLVVPVTVTAVLMLLIAVAARFDLARLTSGVYRHGVVSRASDYTFPYYRDGRTATVSVRRSPDGFITLATNGKPDASMEREWMDTTVASENRQLTRDIATQLLLPIITLAHAPRAADVAVIGFGSGMTSHVLLGSPYVRQVVTIEIEPDMIRGARSFRPANRRAYDDPRSTFVIDDAKSYFASSGRRFDLILSEPSNPWVSGVSGLFTQEFYRRVRGELAPAGVFGQWLHLYELNDGLVTSVLAAIDSIFPAYEIFFTSNADILVVASNQALRAPDWDVTRYAGIASDMRHVVPYDAASFESLRLAGRAVIHPMLLARGAPNSDFFPVLDLGAERMRFMREEAQGYTDLSAGRFDVVAALAGRPADFGRNGSALTPEIPRSEALALGARLRAIRTLPPAGAAAVARDEEVDKALYRLDELARFDATGRAPLDWHAWVDAVVASDADLHSGTAGVVDEAFFADVRGFATRANAPSGAHAALDFLHGIGVWNWREAANAAQALMSSPDPAPWLPDPLLRNGAAVSYIMLHDTAGARNVLRQFAKRTDADEFRERLIASYLIYSDSTLRKKMGWR